MRQFCAGNRSGVSIKHANSVMNHRINHDHIAALFDGVILRGTREAAGNLTVVGNDRVGNCQELFRHH